MRGSQLNAEGSLLLVMGLVGSCLVFPFRTISAQPQQFSFDLSPTAPSVGGKLLLVLSWEELREWLKA